MDPELLLSDLCAQATSPAALSFHAESRTYRPYHGQNDSFECLCFIHRLAREAVGKPPTTPVLELARIVRADESMYGTYKEGSFSGVQYTDVQLRNLVALCLK